MNDAPPARRRLVGAALRRFREQAGFTLGDAARILKCDQSKISRIETGQRSVPSKELGELLVEYGVEPPRQAALMALARQACQAGWWQSYSEVLHDAYQDFINLEASASAIWTYEVQFIPGLLQTEEYARAIGAASLVGESEDERERFVQARLMRQQVLTRDQQPVQFWAILSEGALRQLVGGPDEMRQQLSHLIDIGSTRPNVNIQVLPFAAGAHAATSGPHVIMKFPEAPDLGVVYIEGQTGGIYLESWNDVARYILVFEHLRASALSTAATMRLIDEVARDT